MIIEYEEIQLDNQAANDLINEFPYSTKLESGKGGHYYNGYAVFIRSDNEKIYKAIKEFLINRSERIREDANIYKKKRK